MIEGERILCRNCRGASSSQFLREIRELKRLYKPLMIILLEPKISGEVADRGFKNLGMGC